MLSMGLSKKLGPITVKVFVSIGLKRGEKLMLGVYDSKKTWMLAEKILYLDNLRWHTTLACRLDNLLC